jgi:hypothetical protein
MNEISECVKNKNCSSMDRNFICPWAFERREQLNSNSNASDEEKKLVEETCSQCDTLQQITCAYDIREANRQYLSIVKIFIEDNDPAKPLIFGFLEPTPKINNFNIVANTAKFQSDQDSYKTSLQILTDKLNGLTKSVTTQDQAKNNIKKARELVSEFQQDWSKFHANSEQISTLIDSVYFFMVDWNSSVTSLQNNPACAPVSSQISSAVLEGDALLVKIKNYYLTLGDMQFVKRLRLTEEFTIKAIKLAYSQASQKPLSELEQTLSAVLLLDSEVTKSNLWWIELNRNGLIGGLHTNYYQYEVAMQNLLKAHGEGQKFLATFKSIKGLTSPILTRAIQNLQIRLNEIQGDIDWLKDRGWEGQFKSQKDSVERMLTTPVGKTGLCATSLQSFRNVASKVKSYDDFHDVAEASYLQAVQICEVQK